MTKHISSKQLELTAGKTREELIIQALPPQIDPESPAFKEDMAKVEQIEKQEAARAVLGLDLDEDAFDWENPNEESIVLREQRATAAYRNKAGELVIRQKAGILDDNDSFVFVSAENEVAFLEGLANRAKES